MSGRHIGHRPLVGDQVRMGGLWLDLASCARCGDLLLADWHDVQGTAFRIDHARRSWRHLDPDSLADQARVLAVLAGPVR